MKKHHHTSRNLEAVEAVSLRMAIVAEEAFEKEKKERIYIAKWVSRVKQQALFNQAPHSLQYNPLY